METEMMRPLIQKSSVKDKYERKVGTEGWSVGMGDNAEYSVQDYSRSLNKKIKKNLSGHASPPVKLKTVQV